MQPIDSRDISVVIQGPLAAELPLCLASLAAWAPGAEIIISTWQDQNIAGLEEYTVVQSPDPGGFIDDMHLNNANRQLVSTAAGIARATRPYVLKLRGDHRLTGTRFLQLGSQPSRLFDRPVTVTTLFTRDPARCPMLFHVSDLVQLGTRAAMQKLWGLPLFTREQVMVGGDARPEIFGNMIGQSRLKNASEQLYITALLGLDLPRMMHLSPALIRASERNLLDDFTLLDHAASDIGFPPRFLHPADMQHTLYTRAALDHVRAIIDTPAYRWRIARIYLNKYILSLFTVSWLRSMTAKLSYRITPTLAFRLRAALRAWRARRPSA